MLDWIVAMIDRTGYVGLALLMLAENIFPPIPSEVIMPLAGYTAARGELGLVGVILSGTFGAALGAYFWYWIGQRLGAARVRAFVARHGRWLTLSPEEMDRAVDWFQRYGGSAVLFGRLIPTVRTLISVPAGVVNMPIARFMALTSLGSGVWTALLAGAGYLLADQYEQVSHVLNPFSSVVFGLLLLFWLYRVATFRTQPQDK